MGSLVRPVLYILNLRYLEKVKTEIPIKQQVHISIAGHRNFRFIKNKLPLILEEQKQIFRENI